VIKKLLARVTAAFCYSVTKSLTERDTKIVDLKILNAKLLIENTMTGSDGNLT